MTKTKFIYDADEQYYWFDIPSHSSCITAGVSFKALQFSFKAVKNPSSMRRACLVNEDFLRQVAEAKLRKGQRPVIEHFDEEIEEIWRAEKSR